MSCRNCASLRRLYSTFNKSNKSDLDQLKHSSRFKIGFKYILSNAAICGVVGGSIYLFSESRKYSQRAKIQSSVQGTPLIGGSWSLIDHNGKRRSEKDFFGTYTLIYFGFANCPDICPEELEKQKIVLENIDKKFGNVIQPLFISVDHNRDTPEKLKSFVKLFHSRLIGLTGNEDEIKRVTKLFRVYYNPGVKSDGEYLIDHSIIHYLMDKQGKFIDLYGKNLTPREMTAKIMQVISQRK
ncbi:sco1/2-like protein [Babesia microti strain RI]|uniref:Sco1/2-like protein n=1 Tax=Babesia microti (strain RI) TaxID=1133968 RepID=A0A1N6LY89_BABMR|nr:sco1/2-like protein [Babesia microti strain RI]SIO73835.1 sco1/2-like protein [Babesia microti strain RI]|eukprot:XP_021337890.1 sco1/2-like protein [Babesia microti strain RI]